MNATYAVPNITAVIATRTTSCGHTATKLWLRLRLETIARHKWFRDLSLPSCGAAHQ